MLQDVQCPSCNHEFKSEEWGGGDNCPICEKEFTWDSYYNDDRDSDCFGDEYFFPDWRE